MKRGIVLILGLILATISSASLPGNRFSARIISFPGHSRSDSVNQEQSRKFLSGVWENLIKEVVLNDTQPNGRGKVRIQWATLRFSFRPDGLFTRVLKSKTGEIRFEEQGYWELSPDGRQLLLEFPDADGGAYTQTIRIKYLVQDEMVLEHPLSIVGNGYASLDKSDSFFNRQ